MPQNYSLKRKGYLTKNHKFDNKLEKKGKCFYHVSDIHNQVEKVSTRFLGEKVKINKV